MSGWPEESSSMNSNLSFSSNCSTARCSSWLRLEAVRAGFAPVTMFSWPLMLEMRLRMACRAPL